MALIFAKLLKGRPYEEIGSVCETIAMYFNKNSQFMLKTNLQLGNLFQSIVPENKIMACKL